MIPTTSPEFMEGARACLMAMRRAGRMVAPTQQTMEEYYRARDAAIATIVEAAGPLPHRASGALAVLAECIVLAEQEDCGCAPDDWVPESTMLPDERTSARAEFAAYCEEGAGAPSNVIPLSPR